MAQHPPSRSLAPSQNGRFDLVKGWNIREFESTSLLLLGLPSTTSSIGGYQNSTPSKEYLHSKILRAHKHTQLPSALPPPQHYELTQQSEH